MVEGGLAVKAVLFHTLAAELAAAVTTDLTGVLAAEVLPDVLGAVRQGELATCLLVERVDRTGESAVDGPKARRNPKPRLGGPEVEPGSDHWTAHACR